MRYVFLVLMCLMLLFMAVQYNDPDGAIWMFFYGIPAVWCAIAFFKLRVFLFFPVRLALLCSLAGALFGVVYYWPLTPGFWNKQVWFNVETAREGMGMMIVAVVLASVFVFSSRTAKRSIV